MMINIKDGRIAGEMTLSQAHTLKIRTIDTNDIAVLAGQLTFRQVHDFTGMP
ncbi:hypothetical protein D3C76_1765060 [compost metagenome]